MRGDSTFTAAPTHPGHPSSSSQLAAMTWSACADRLCSWEGALYFAVATKLQYLLYSDPCPWKGEQSNWLQKIVCNSISSFARFWHDYEIHCPEDLQSLRGNTLLVGYHSRCTLDLAYMFCTMRSNIVVTYLFYTVQLTRKLLPLLRILPSKNLNGGSTADTFVEALAERPEPLILLPGGAWECMKQSPDQLKVNWKDAPGFARVIRSHPALGRHTRVYAFYSRNCERCLWSTTFWHDLSGRWAMKTYDLFKAGHLMVLPPMLMLMMTSTGFLLLPNPVKVDTYLTAPMTIGDDETAEAFTERVRCSLQALIERVEALPADDRRGLLHRLAMVPYGAYTLAHNAVLYSCVTATILAMYPPLLAYSCFRLIVGDASAVKSKAT